MDIDFPVEFIVPGTPLSFQSKRPAAKAAWKEQIRRASASALPQPSFASSDPISATIFHFPDASMEGDIDNIVKLFLDALGRHLYLDDAQVERIVIQKFEPDRTLSLRSASAVLQEALLAERPVTYVRISNDPLEDLR